MGQYRRELGPAHGLVQKLRAHHAADGQAELHVGEIHQHQRQQKVRRRQADVTQQRQAMVTPTVLVGGGVNADGKRYRPGEKNNRDVEHEGQHQSVTHHVDHRQVVFERPAPIALEQTRESTLAGPDADPGGVLLQKRLVQAKLVPQELHLLQRRRIALAAQLGDLVRQEVARWQLDDDEGDEADHQQCRDHQQNAPQRVDQHLSSCARPRTRRYRAGRCRRTPPGPSCTYLCRERSSVNC